MAKNSTVSPAPVPVASARKRTDRAATSATTPSGALFSAFQRAIPLVCTGCQSIGARAFSANARKGMSTASNE